MKVTYSWIIYSSLIFGTRILSQKYHGFHLSPISTIPDINDEMYNCSNGEPILWSSICDGFENCSDGSDETKELCALFEFETNMTMDCGRVHNMKNKVKPDEAHQSITELAPWTVAVYKKNEDSKFDFICPGSMISLNIVISGFFLHLDGQFDLFKIGPMVVPKLLADFKLLINVTMIYSVEDDLRDRFHLDTYRINTIEVIVLANKLPLSNGFGFTPICIDWFSNYDIRKETQMRTISYKYIEDKKEVKVVQYFTNYTTENEKEIYIKFNTENDPHIIDVFLGSGLGILNSNSYFLTGIVMSWSPRNHKSEVYTMQFTNIIHYVPLIRGIFNKHVTVNSCVLPTVEGVIYSYEGSDEILSHGTLIDRHVNIIENCEVGYHKAFRYGFRFCLGKGKWLSSSDKLCFKMCPPLESDSIDIICTYNGKYANCTNPSIPDTIAIPLCKPSYTAQNGHEEEPLELLCQPNGAWNNELYRCNPRTSDLCDRKFAKRPAVSPKSKLVTVVQTHFMNTYDKYNCSNGETIEWSWLCDGYEDCLDGSDEIKELCALFEFETNMTMDCGRVHNMKNKVKPDEAHQSITELAPWTVAVYKKNADSKFDFIHPGSIIAPNIVISFSYYFRDICKTYEPMDDSKLNLFKIGPMTPLVNLLEDYKLLINVTMIYSTADTINYRYGNDAEKTISVIVLANKLPLSNGFAPICIDWFNKYDIRKKTQMRIIGWNHNGGNKEVKVVQYFTHYRMANDEIDKTFVITFNTNQHINGVFLGSGLGISYSNSYFLTGIVWNWSNGNNLSEVHTMQFADIKHYVPWIRGILNKHVTVNSCVLPTVEGVIYSYEGSDEILSHGTLVDRHVNIIENCEVGYHKAFRYGFRFCLGKGKWLSSSDKLCFKMCPPLESDSLYIECFHNGKYANCTNPSKPETIAKPSCKPLYTAPNGLEKEPLELLCMPNGAWNKGLYRCNPSCGKNYTINDGIIMGGGSASAGTAPWNVGVYQFNKTISNDYDLICGGSIISPNLVVSAAHCFWEKGMLSHKISVNDGQYKIAVGKYSINITKIDNELFTKIMNVESVHLHENYRGYAWFHADDISIVVLENTISFSIGVSPVCVDWMSINTIRNGDKGKIVGWGKTEKGIASPILLEASLPYIDHRTCREMYKNGFELYVTKDKFCAGSELGQGVNSGDSGAGLSFLHSNLYYLTGVASVKDPNTNNSIAVFTEVKHHIQWINKLYNNRTL
ncbi:uncharacterized protein LOC132946240 [Metopolophium dirhodum]|uniref:uncharacterized protein LOC132946240 n=1 Tax=Metopolophium dirhodum TaxID=44670 RepID=UPI0029903D89|nr:uncharacterized protein LOC132946240 [Metopolophium dirhodum]